MSRSPEKSRPHPPPASEPAVAPPPAHPVEPQLTAYDPKVDAIYKKGYTVLRDMVHELEDENNMIALQIAKARMRMQAAHAHRSAIASAVPAAGVTSPVKPPIHAADERPDLSVKSRPPAAVPSVAQIVHPPDARAKVEREEEKANDY